MARSVIANCNPAMIGWARSDAGYSVESAAETTKFPVARLRAWEAGEDRPTIPQLRKLAQAYRRPLAAFFMGEPPQPFRPMRDFRRLPDEADARWSPALRALIRRAQRQQRVYVRLLADLGEQPAELPRAPESNEPDVVAAFARETLGVDLAEQQTWRDDTTALRGWIHAIEDQGVLTLHTSTTRGQTVPTREMLGFSEPYPVPIIVLNGSDFARRRVFTLLHEFAHLLLRSAGVCDLHDQVTTPNFDPTEVFCNAVAAAVLMPRDAFLRDVDVRRGGRDVAWSDDELGRIARRYTTSREAALRRLLTLGLTTDGYYRVWREQYYRGLEAAVDDEAPGGFANYYTMKVRELSVPYVNTILGAYHRDDISASDVARFLNIKLKNLPRLEEELATRLERAG